MTRRKTPPPVEPIPTAGEDDPLQEATEVEVAAALDYIAGCLLIPSESAATLLAMVDDLERALRTYGLGAGSWDDVLAYAAGLFQLLRDALSDSSATGEPPVAAPEPIPNAVTDPRD